MTACSDAPTVLTWPLHATVGTLTSPLPAPSRPLSGLHGDDALVCCDLISAGKFRHGAARWWCRTHMQTWGTLADLAGAEQTQRMRCALRGNPMGYAVAPPLIDLAEYDSVVIRWRPAAALTGGADFPEPPALQIRLRSAVGGETVIAAPALSLRLPPGLFADPAIALVHLTPPAVRALMRALEQGHALGCVDCRRCGHPHLDLEEFAQRPHQRHLCGNCGYDSSYSTAHMVSSPLHAVRQRHGTEGRESPASGMLDLDAYAGCAYCVRPSLSPVLDTGGPAPLSGVEVQVWRAGEQIVNATFAAVRYWGRPLDRNALLSLAPP